MASAARDDDTGEDLPFSSGALWRRTSFVPGLTEALLHADIVNCQQLGKWLQRVSGVTVEGLVIERVGLTRAGAVWLVRRTRE